MKTIENTILSHDMLQSSHIVVGLSGGADSIALSHALYALSDKLHFTFSAVHINHMFRSDSDIDQQLSEDFCKTFGINLTVTKVDVAALASQNNDNFEATARRVRYDTFVKAASGESVIATAHTLNDSLETSLFNLARGTGITGLCGIKAKSQYAGRTVIRPLINCLRADVEGYCVQNNLLYATDSTNFDISYSRNRIRHNVVSQLSIVSPSLHESYSRMKTQLSAIDNYITAQANALLLECCVNGMIDVRCACTADDVVLSKAITINYSGYLESQHICGIIDIIRNGSGSCNLPHNHTATVRHGCLQYDAHNNITANEINIDITSEMAMRKDFTKNFLYKDILNKCEKYGKIKFDFKRYDTALAQLDKTYKQWHIDCDKLVGNVTLRTAKGTDKIKLAHRGITKCVKELVKELRLNQFQQDNLLLVEDQNGVVFISRVGVDARVMINKDTKITVSLI